MLKAKWILSAILATGIIAAWWLQSQESSARPTVQPVVAPPIQFERLVTPENPALKLDDGTVEFDPPPVGFKSLPHEPPSGFVAPPPLPSGGITFDPRNPMSLPGGIPLPTAELGNPIGLISPLGPPNHVGPPMLGLPGTTPAPFPGHIPASAGQPFSIPTPMPTAPGDIPTPVVPR